ncbi:pheromone-binding protein Gp-9 [Monomorium pharaonis]|uniref:pheromone-binding protein Gp-9 n=1 Tax=Monomorium pharaonis TaxID=307658 RepID=UPI00063F4EC1|nr:pheromone-binding protein Gp-9 [Monomorium pharaonis]
MKSFVLCTFVFILASSGSTELKQQLKNAVGDIRDSVLACTNEIGLLSPTEMYEEEEIMTNVHTESGNEERTRKNGCFIACILKKENLMDGTNIKEAQVHLKLDEYVRPGREQGIAHKIARRCMKEARSITEECEKGFSLYSCVLRSLHKVMKHEEHEKEETEEETETEQTLNKQEETTEEAEAEQTE